jgi:hypothetical protein
MSPEDTPITEEAITNFFQYLADTDTDTNWFGQSQFFALLPRRSLFLPHPFSHSVLVL